MNIDLRDEYALVDSVGADLGGLASALEKVALYVGPDSGNLLQRTMSSCGESRCEESIFGSQMPLKEFAGGFQISHQIVNVSRNHPLALLGLVASHWRRLTVTRAMLDDRAPKGDIEAALSLPPFVVEKIMRQARNQTLPRLVLGLRAIAEADQALKGGRLPPIRIMESLVLRLC